MNVLLTCAGRRHYLARYFKDFLGHRGTLVGVDLTQSAAALAQCDRAYAAPPITDANYLNILVDICKREKIDFVFSLNDLELQLLSDNMDFLEEATGSKFVISSSDTIRHCTDKLKTYELCRDNNILSPRTFISIGSSLEAIKTGEIKFPLIVKPRWGSGSIGIHKASDRDSLFEAASLCEQSIAASPLCGFGGNQDPIIIQEFISGDEYGVDVLNDVYGHYIGHCAKRKLAMRGGETDKAITVDGALFEPIARRLADALKHRGNLDCDFIIRDGTPYLLELNPRFGGGYPFTHEAGANHIRYLLGANGQPPKYSYELGRSFAKCDTLIDVSNIDAIHLGVALHDE